MNTGMINFVTIDPSFGSLVDVISSDVAVLVAALFVSTHVCNIVVKQTTFFMFFFIKKMDNLLVKGREISHENPIFIDDTYCNVLIEDCLFNKHTKPCIFVKWTSNNQSLHRQITISNCKFVSCSCSTLTKVSDTNKLKWVCSPIISFGSKGHSLFVRDCTFSEFGVNDDKFPLSSTCVFVSGFEKFEMSGCTIDGCVGIIQAFGVCVIDVDDGLIKDVFFTDIFSKDARTIYYDNSNIDVQKCNDTNILSNVLPNQFMERLRHHPSYKDDHVSEKAALEAIHIKGVVPFHQENLDVLLNDHKWREFRTLERLVCHNADKRSPMTARYARWVAKMCKHVFDVNVTVDAAFANLYPNGKTGLPLHRDQYHKWVIGLSFGETRSFYFVPDCADEPNVKYELSSGDVLIFSPDVNNHYQHYMPEEPEKTGMRINLTFFVTVHMDDEQTTKQKFLGQQTKLDFKEVEF